MVPQVYFQILFFCTNGVTFKKYHPNFQLFQWVIQNLPSYKPFPDNKITNTTTTKKKIHQIGRAILKRCYDKHVAIHFYLLRSVIILTLL